ncbi:MAG TPA: hypothetical protein PKD15_00880 [Candidatus Saccharibacteria bacterium]|nr:hypothetical protein [Candidatus Saccharibacteria bacterium]
MNNKVAQPGYYLRTYDRDIFITKQQKDVLYKAMDNGAEYLDLKDDHRIMLNQVKEIVPAFEYKKTQLGGFYCSKHPDNFVPKGKRCGHCGV